MKFHHIGVASEDIKKSISHIRSIYEILSISEIIFDSQQNADLCLITLKDGTNIELVAGDVVKTFIKKNITIYHTCWEVDNINQSIESYIKVGALLISEPKPAILFNNRKVAFLSTELGIVELLEKG